MTLQIMREWIPVSSSPKGRLALQALREYGRRRSDVVTVGEIAAEAGVTTGPLYHHFRNELGLYTFVRDDVERRLIDRMQGAAATLQPRRALPRIGAAARARRRRRRRTSRPPRRIDSRATSEFNSRRPLTPQTPRRPLAVLVRHRPAEDSFGAANCCTRERASGLGA